MVLSPPPSLNVTMAIFIIYTWNPRTTQPSPPPSSIRMKMLQPTCAYVPGNARVRPGGKIRLCEHIFLFIYFFCGFFLEDARRCRAYLTNCVKRKHDVIICVIRPIWIFIDLGKPPVNVEAPPCERYIIIIISVRHC